MNLNMFSSKSLLEWTNQASDITLPKPQLQYYWTFGGFKSNLRFLKRKIVRYPARIIQQTCLWHLNVCSFPATCDVTYDKTLLGLSIFKPTSYAMCINLNFVNERKSQILTHAFNSCFFKLIVILSSCCVNTPLQKSMVQMNQIMSLIIWVFPLLTEIVESGEK